MTWYGTTCTTAPTNANGAATTTLDEGPHEHEAEVARAVAGAHLGVGDAEQAEVALVAVESLEQRGGGSGALGQRPGHALTPGQVHLGRHDGQGAVHDLGDAAPAVSAWRHDA